MKILLRQPETWRTRDKPKSNPGNDPGTSSNRCDRTALWQVSRADDSKECNPIPPRCCRKEAAAGSPRVSARFLKKSRLISQNFQECERDSEDGQAGKNSLFNFSISWYTWSRLICSFALTCGAMEDRSLLFICEATIRTKVRQKYIIIENSNWLLKKIHLKIEQFCEKRTWVNSSSPLLLSSQSDLFRAARRLRLELIRRRRFLVRDAPFVRL